MVKVVRTSEGLRDLLFDELVKLVNDETSPQRANAVARGAAAIIESARLDLDVTKFRIQQSCLGEICNQDLLPATKLGNK